MPTENQVNPGLPRSQRKSARVGLEAEVVVRRASFPNFRVRILNLSLDGCAMEFVDRPAVSERVWVKLEALEAIEGRVCWVKNGLAGVKFDQPMHSAVFEMLVGRLK